MNSKDATRYARSVEQQIRDREGYETPADGRKWRDARSSNGRDIEIKAAVRERSNGRPGKFRIFREAHERLIEAGGVYHFAVYEPRGGGAEIIADRRVRARRIRGLNWSNSDHSTRDVGGRARQSKVRIREIFG